MLLLESESRGGLKGPTVIITRYNRHVLGDRDIVIHTELLFCIREERQAKQTLTLMVVLELKRVVLQGPRTYRNPRNGHLLPVIQQG